ncbi:twin-arginine translocase TatA/TatE family subunit [Pontiellaceae bacterium B1224]|nr:twin-arginine translocase TatA/TatE family subunit [Pontiellaceae bacterium B1224]
MPGGSEVLLVLFVFLLLFGAKKLPELSRALGRSLGEFKKGKEDLEREIRDVEKDMHKAATEDIREEAGPAAEKVKESEIKSANEPAAPDRS